MLPSFSLSVGNTLNQATSSLSNLLSGGGSGPTSGGIASMMLHLQQNLPALTSAIFGFCYLSGIWLSFRAIYKLKQYGELRTMMSSNTDLREPMLLFAAAAMLMYLPTAISFFENSFFSNYTATAISYQTNTTGTQWHIIKAVVLNLIRIVGVIAIVKGVFILSGLSAGAGGQNTIGKAMTFLVGGVFAANIDGFITMIGNSLGVTFS